MLTDTDDESDWLACTNCLRSDKYDLNQSKLVSVTPYLLNLCIRISLLRTSNPLDRSNIVIILEHPSFILSKQVHNM